MATTEQRQAARAWLAEHGQPETTGDLLDAIIGVYGDGAQLGQAEAQQLVGQAGDWAAYWDAWQPGNQAAADLLADGGFAGLLDTAGVNVQGIVGTTLDRMGTLLADGAQSGASVDDIAAALAALVDDPDRAYQIADTELNRAVSSASMQEYDAHGVAQWEWLISPDACDECVDMADGGPYDVDSGEGQPPLHPACRCSVSPIVSAADNTDVEDEG